jgi:hypothetical protein
MSYRAMLSAGASFGECTTVNAMYRKNFFCNASPPTEEDDVEEAAAACARILRAASAP